MSGPDDDNPDISAEFEAVRANMAEHDADAYFEARMIDRLSKAAASAERTAAAVERISQHVGQIASSEIAPALTTIATAVDRMAIAAQAVEQIAHDVRAALQAGAALAEEFGPTARRAARQVADLIARYAPPPSRKR